MRMLYSVDDPVSMKFFQPAEDHVGDGLDVLLDQRINRVLEVVVEIGLAVLHHDAELVVLDLVVVDPHDLVTPGLRFRAGSVPGSRSLARSSVCSSS